MHSLQTKIFIFFVALLLIVQSIALWTINRATNEQSQQSIDTRLSTASTIFKTLYLSESEKLSAVAKTAAQDGALRDVFYEDQRSFLVALNNHRKRIDADIVIAIDDQGIIKAELIAKQSDKKLSEKKASKVSRGLEIGKRFRFQDWLSFPEEDRLYPLKNQIYQLSVAPVKSGQDSIGWIAFGFLIDEKRASEFAGITDLDTNFILINKAQITNLASSSKQPPEIAFHRAIIANNQQQEIIATVIDLGEIGFNQDKSLKVVLHGSRSDLLAAIEKRLLEFLALAGITLFLSLAGAYLIAATITKPLKKLVKRAKFIAKGNYETKVKVSDKGEMGQLAKEFNLMQDEINQREKTITHQAFHNPLTNLPNRNKLINCLEENLNGTSENISIFLINIGHIKQINNSLGHSVGDQVLKEVALRLSRAFDKTKIFHLGADEFILIFNKDSQDEVDKNYRLIKKQLTEPYVNQVMTLKFNFHCGISIFPDHSINAEDLIQKAATALHFSKMQKTNYLVYSPSFDVNTLEQLNLMNDLSVAIKSGQLVLFYQPKVTLEICHIETVEALVRWQHPTIGMIPPDKFISIAESTGQINALTYWVIEEAARQYSLWIKQDIKLIIAVNISAENLKDPVFYQSVLDILAKYSVPVSGIMLEITESAVVEDPKEAIRLLLKFKDKGFKLSIDDYGTGYSSLAQLKDLPVDELKIDMSFVLRLPNDKGDKIIVRSTIELAHNMGLTVVAEGVENEAALKWLSNQGCERAQGYHISRPLPASELESWLTDCEFYKPSGYDKLAKEEVKSENSKRNKP